MRAAPDMNVRRYALTATSRLLRKGRRDRLRLSTLVAIARHLTLWLYPRPPLFIASCGSAVAAGILRDMRAGTNPASDLLVGIALALALGCAGLLLLLVATSAYRSSSTSSASTSPSPGAVAITGSTAPTRSAVEPVTPASRTGMTPASRTRATPTRVTSAEAPPRPEGGRMRESAALPLSAVQSSPGK